MRVSPRASVRDAPAAPARQGLKLLQPYPPIIGEQPYGLHMHLACTMQARVVAIGLPHHITQRGNARQDVFTKDSLRRAYLQVLSEHAAENGPRVLACCLMRNHVHIVAVPEGGVGSRPRHGLRGEQPGAGRDGRTRGRFLNGRAREH
jgi:hypothetical protein